MVLELISQLLHRRHVCKQDWLNHSLFENLDFLWGEFTWKEIILHEVKQFDRLGGVEVFLDMVLPIHLAQRRVSYNVVAVIETIVLSIMAQSGNEEAESV
jgi:hypothetical protein